MVTHLRVRAARPRPDREAGFSIVEVMVAMLVLVVAVLGTLSLVQTSMASTSRTAAREQGTSLARDLVERARQLQYSQVTMAGAPAAVRAALPAADGASAVAGNSFTVRRRGFTYTVTVNACSIDDTSDGVGVGDSTFCKVPDPEGAGEIGRDFEESTQPAASVNVLGIAVNAGGSLVDTVCGALGNPDLLGAVTGAVSPVAPLSVCPEGNGVEGTAPFDSAPDDLRRVRVTVSWDAGRPEHLSQTTLLTNPVL